MQKEEYIVTKLEILKGVALTKVTGGAGSKLVGNRIIGHTLDGVIVAADQVRK